MATLPQGRTLGWWLLGGFVFFFLLTLGLAFTYFSWAAAALALACLISGVSALAGSRGDPQPLEDAYERWRIDDSGK